jgi:hypothetical protein
MLMSPKHTNTVVVRSKVKAVPLAPCRRQGGEEIELLLILNLGTGWSEWSASRPGRALPPGMDPVPID